MPSNLSFPEIAERKPYRRLGSGGIPSWAALMPPLSPRSGKGTRRLIRRGEPTGLVPRGPGAEDGFSALQIHGDGGAGGEPRQDPSGFLTAILGHCVEGGSSPPVHNVCIHNIAAM
jgi:hypothetical protein